MKLTIDLQKKILIISQLKIQIFPKFCECRNLHKLFYYKTFIFYAFLQFFEIIDWITVLIVLLANNDNYHLIKCYNLLIS